MNFDFSDEAKALKEQARRFLAEKAGPTVTRASLSSTTPYDKALWADIIGLGWTSARVPEAWGGLGLSALEQCVLAEEIGRSLAPVPFVSSALLATELLLLAPLAQQQRSLSLLASGEAIGVVAWAQSSGVPTALPAAKVSNNRLTGIKQPIADGMAATFAIVTAISDDDEPGDFSLWLVELNQNSIRREPVETLDILRPHARLTFKDATATRLSPVGQGRHMFEQWLQTAAVLCAFEALGTAEAALEMSTSYAKQRVAFGRVIGGYQAVKHKCADMYIKCELARAHAYYGAWALASGAPELPLAAAGARVSALDALRFTAEENVQIHGGIGFTWESDCQFYYRRARQIGLALGSRGWWADRLVRALEQRNRPAA